MLRAGLQILTLEMEGHLNCYVQDQTERGILIAHKYRTGLYPIFRPDHELAIELYNALLENCTIIQHNTIQHALNSMLGAADTVGCYADMPKSWGLQLLERLRTGAPTRRRRRVRLPAAAAAAAAEARLDPQNVHDSFVVDATNRSIELLLKEWRTRKLAEWGWLQAAPQQQLDTDYAALCDALGTALSKDTELEAAFPIIERVLRHIQQLQTPEALHLLCAVLWKIGQQEEPLRSNLLHTLGCQLESAEEHGLPVCLTGIKTRLNSVLETLPGAVRMCSLDTLRQEVLQVARRVRDSWIASASQEEKDDYMQGDEALAQQMRDEFILQLHKEYTALMSPRIIQMFEHESVEYF